ncbi:DivIVA domain-containing protein [Actinoplanes subglobosus]|uniref:DivIVA domain-containing protein n=1 Tax=Actinoplanes subglobosus TaxID=1547892 RepID=A0ABV8IHZ4_9ACTN
MTAGNSHPGEGEWTDAGLATRRIRDAVFRRARLGRRGYHEGHVDEFLEVLEQTFAELAAENRNLKMQLWGPADASRLKHAAFVTRLRELRRERASAEDESRHLQQKLDHALDEAGTGRRITG